MQSPVEEKFQILLIKLFQIRSEEMDCVYESTLI